MCFYTSTFDELAYDIVDARNLMHVKCVGVWAKEGLDEIDRLETISADRSSTVETRAIVMCTDDAAS